jgi:glycosyltransferase involved in cell wall biosynthesis
MTFAKYEFAILSFNKASMTRSLIESIYRYEKEFDFVITILDQASHTNERSILEQLAAKYSRIRLIDSHVNRGVGGGRNYLIENAISEWLIFLDNDLELKGSVLNELYKKSSDNYFFSMPFFEEGNHSSPPIVPYLYLEGEPGSMKATAGLGGVPFEDFLKGTLDKNNLGVAGGAFIARTSIFQELGGYRAPGLVGYEDLELTLRIRNLGYKIHVLEIEPLMHNKSRASLNSDMNSEIQRLNTPDLKANANYIEKCHGYKVWGENQYAWLVRRAIDGSIQKEMIRNINSNIFEVKKLNSRPRILLVCDVPGWAFHNIALQYKLLFSHLYEFIIVFNKNWSCLGTTLFSENWAGIIFLWRVPLFQLVKDGDYPSEFLHKTGYHVCDYLGNLGFDDEVHALNLSGAQTAYVNRELFAQGKNIKTSAHYVPDGVSTDIFFPNIGKPLNKKLTVGWVGNSKWGGVDDVKGFGSVIKPAMIEVEKQNSYIKFEFIDSTNGGIRKIDVAKQMRRWDVIICASKHEGTPNPVLEGLATGLEIISTRVGMLPEIEKSGGTVHFIDRDPECLARAIISIEKIDVEQRRIVQLSNRAASLRWDWKTIANQYQNFILAVIGGTK